MSSQSSTSIKRLWQIRRIIKKYQLVELFNQLNLSGSAQLAIRMIFGSTKASSLPQAPRIRQALEELGPVFVKLGQALSTRPDLLPADVAIELSKLQDQVPPFSGEQALEIIKQCYGDGFHDIFESVDVEAMASASVAQVHAATLKSGLAIEGKNKKASNEVIIKVIRPNVEELINRDLAVMNMGARLLDKHWPRAQQLRPKEVIRDYQDTILGELDLRREAANCSQMAANFEGTDIIYVPQVYWDYTSKGVMVMERIYGTPVRDFETLVEKGFDLEELASDAVETFFKQAFVDNFFHADMHPGNIFVSEQGKWIAIDFGIMGVLNDSDKRYLAEMLLGFFNRDYAAIAQAHRRAGWIPEQTNLADFEAAIRMVCEPNFAKPISEISFGLVLMQLFETVQRFEMPVQPQLVLLYKTLLNIEGIGRQLYPQLNLWDTAKPFLESWMKEQISPQAVIQDLKRDWPRWRAILSSLPDHLEKMQMPQQAVQSKKPATEPKSIKGSLLLALAAFLVMIAGSANLLPTTPAVLALAQWVPVVGGVAIIWAYVKNC